MDVSIKFSDSRSNGFRDIRGAGFVSNERTLAKPIARNAYGVWPKNYTPNHIIQVRRRKITRKLANWWGSVKRDVTHPNSGGACCPCTYLLSARPTAVRRALDLHSQRPKVRLQWRYGRGVMLSIIIM